MSHSFAVCPAPIFSQASWESLCAAARFGCFLPLTLSTGFCAMAIPPQINAAPSAVPNTILAFVILRILLFVSDEGTTTQCKPELAGEVALLCCGGHAAFGNKNAVSRTQNRHGPEGQVPRAAALAGRSSQRVEFQRNLKAQLLHEGHDVPYHRRLQDFSISNLVDRDSADRDFLVCGRDPEKLSAVRSRYRPCHHQLVFFAHRFVDAKFQVRQRLLKALDLPAVRRRTHGSAGKRRIAQCVTFRDDLVDEFEPPLVPYAMVKPSKYFLVGRGDGHDQLLSGMLFRRPRFASPCSLVCALGEGTACRRAYSQKSPVATRGIPARSSRNRR